VKKLYDNLEGEHCLKGQVYISLGSNIGNKEQNLAQAIDMIGQTAKINVTRESSLYITAPWGKTDQDDFLNQVIEIETELAPLELLYVLHEIEIKLGRLRNEVWGPRVIDLDILLYGGEIVDSLELKIPHPYLFERLFVLIPLQEIAPQLIFPDGKGIREVLARVAQLEDASQSIKKKETNK
jgi:2-amino-4-hydroxy-6-hydroxymethyldihydropteridine diphosphokinase